MSEGLTPIGSEEERIDRRAELARTLAQGGMDGVHVLSLETAQTVLTPNRAEIIDLLNRERFESVRTLARRLDRDNAQVSRELSILFEHGIIDYDTDGRSKRPHLSADHFVIEPLV